jgi:AraC family transcriptional regulator
MQGANYGRQLAHALRAGENPTLLARPGLRTSEIAITEVRRNSPNYEYNSTIAREDSFLLALNIGEWAKRIFWIDDKPISTVPLKAGTANIYDLRREYAGYGASSFHMISFYMPRAVLNSVADMDGMSRIDTFTNDPACGVDDAVIRELGFSLLPALRRPDEANMLFVDHITTAIVAHIMRAHGNRSSKPQQPLQKLDHWQEMRVKEIVAANLDGRLSIAQLARATGLTLSEFKMAFSATVGMQPHHWLLERQIERAMCLISAATAPLEAVAAQCGFKSEAHLKRMFGRVVGETPENWRRIILS